MLKILISALSLALITGCASSPNLGTPSAKADSSFSQTSFAYGAARYARANKSLEAYLVALEALANAPTSDARHTKTSDGGDGASDKAGEAPSLETLAAEARTLAGDNADAQNRINQLVNGAKAGAKGARGGSKRHVDIVRSHATDVYELTFRGGETAEVFVSGDGDSDLDLFVYDENGGLICLDDDQTDDCYCRWTPRWTGSFSVKIKNLGGIANRYLLLTN